MRPDLLLPLLAVPGTDTPPRLRLEATAAGIPYAGWLLDDADHAIARLDDFRFDFVHLDHAAETRRAAEAGPPRALAPNPG